MPIRVTISDPLALALRRGIIIRSAQLLGALVRGDESVLFSIVMTTQDRSTYVDLTLGMLERQWVPSELWEVVLIDIDSRDDTSQVISRFSTRGSLPLRPFRLPRVSRGVALNHAIEMTRGKIIVFLGDDRIVSPEFLYWHLMGQLTRLGVVLGDCHRCIHTHVCPLLEPAQFGYDSAPAVTASDLADRDRVASLVFDQGGDYERIFRHFAQHNQRNPFPWVYFDTANASVPRSVLRSTGGFDQGHAGWNLGDWGLLGKELALRMHCSDVPFSFQPRATAFWQVSQSRVIPLPDRSRNLSYLLAQHHELDRSILERIFLRESVRRAP